MHGVKKRAFIALAAITALSGARMPMWSRASSGAQTTAPKQAPAEKAKAPVKTQPAKAAEAVPAKGSSKQPHSKTKKAPAQTAATKKAEQVRRKKEFEEMIVAEEKQAWEEEKKQNADYFRETMTDQFVAAEPDGKRYTKADVLPLIPTVKMSSFELTDFQLIRAGRDAAVVTYRAAVHEASEGKETTTNVLATTVWVRRGKEWKMTFHQKTLAPAK